MELEDARPVARFGGARVEVLPLGVGDDGGGELGAVDVMAGVLGRFGFGQVGVEGGGARACRRALRQFVAAVHERFGRAARRIVERARGSGGAIDHRPVGMREQLDERALLRQLRVEAGHAQIEELGRLLAAQARRRAGVLAHAQPRRGPLVERCGDVGEGARRLRSRAGGEGVLHVAATGRIPDAVDEQLATSTNLELVPRYLVLHERDRSDEQRHAGKRADTPPARARISRQLVEERAHRRMAVGGIDAQAAHDHALEPRRHARAVGLAHLSRVHLAAQFLDALGRVGARAEERFVERDAEAVDVGARVDVRAEELLGRHVAGRADERAGDGERRRPARLGDAAGGTSGDGGTIATALVRAERARQAEVGDADAPRRRPTSTLSGLKSRCTSPAACAAARPAPACDEHVDDLAPRARPRAQPLRASVTPSTSSMATNTLARACRTS